MDELTLEQQAKRIGLIKNIFSSKSKKGLWC